MSFVFNLGAQYIGPGWPVLPNYTATQIFASNIGTGNIDLFTVPAGKRAICSVVFWNSTASSIVTVPMIKIGGTYYPTSTQLTFASTATAAANQQYAIVMEAGQICAVNTTGTGLNATGIAHVFDNTSGLKSSVITTFINGDNTVYTCPAGKTAHLAAHIANLLSGNAASAQLQGMNNTAGTLTYHWNFVPNGGSASTSNQISQAVSAAATAGLPANFQQNTQGVLTPGDAISVNGTSTNANQIAWVNVIEQ